MVEGPKTSPRLRGGRGGKRRAVESPGVSPFADGEQGGSGGSRGPGSDELETSLLLEFYKLQISRSEHYETLRATLTGVVATIAAAFIALATIDGSVSAEDAWHGSGLIVLGAFGAAANLLHGRRAARYGLRAEAFRDALDDRVPGARLNEIRSKVPSGRTYLNSVWIWLHASILTGGGVLLWQALH